MNTLKFGNGEWYGKKDTILAYNDENSNFKPLPFSFDRDTSATRVNKDGLIETVGSGEPRIDYKDDSKGALLLEPTRSNLITNSNNLTTWNGAAMTRTLVDDLINPSNGLDASKLLQSASGGYAWLSRTFTGNETFSAFVKKDSSNFARLYAANNTVYFDIVNGTIETEVGSDITDKSIIDYGNGWFRISMSVNSTAASYVRIYPASSGSSSSGTNSLFVYGAQLEQGSYATSYIPTQGGAATRVQETSATVSNNINNFGTSNFSLFIESYIKEGYNARLKKMQTWTARGYGFYVNAYGLRGRVYGDSQIDTSYVGIGSVINNSKNKALMVVDRVLNTITIYSNGVNVHSQSIASIAGDSLDNTSPLEFQRAIDIEAGLINDFRIYNTALTNQESIALTKI